MLITVVIPFYNEIASVPRTVDHLSPVLSDMARGNSIELLLVDDGSRDGTSDAIQTHSQIPQGIDFSIETHSRNLGLGAALRTGFQKARGDVIVTTDFDGTYSFAEIPSLLALLTPDVDIVTASPYHPAGGVDGVAPFRLLLSRGSSVLYRALVDWRVYTYTSIFRAYRRVVLHSVHFDSTGFLAGTELLVRAMLLGYRVKEYPAVLHARSEGTSKAKLALTTQTHLRFQTAVILHRLGLRKFSGQAQNQPNEVGQA